MIGVGIDLVDLERFRRALVRTPGIVRRCFTEAEADYARRRRDPTERFAARFAAKEAVMKAMGVGLWRVGFLEIEVVRAPSGQPTVRLSGRGAERAAALGVRTWHLSITHTEHTAQAIAIAE